MNEIEIPDNSQGIWWTRPTFSVMLETMSVKVSSFILIEESETRIKGWTAALYAGNMLFILGFTPGERWFFKTADNELENLCCCLCCLLLLPQTERDLQCLFIFWKKRDIQWYWHVFKWIYPKLDFLLQLEASDFLYDSKLWLTHSKTASKYFAFDIRIFLYQTLKKISWSSILQSLENKAWYFVICYDSIGLSGDMKISLTYCKQLKHYHSILLVKMIISNSTFTYA